MCIAILSAFCHSSTSGLSAVVRQSRSSQAKRSRNRVLVAKELLLLLLWEQKERGKGFHNRFSGSMGGCRVSVCCVCVGITGCAADADAQDFDSLTLLPGNAFPCGLMSSPRRQLLPSSSCSSPPAYLSLAPCVSVSTIAVRTRTESG